MVVRKLSQKLIKIDGDDDSNIEKLEFLEDLLDMI